MSVRDDYPMLAMLTEVEYATKRDLAERDEMFEHVEDLRYQLHCVNLRNRSLTHERARLARVAIRLVNACVEDDDDPTEYLAALDALSDMVRHPQFASTGEA
jgi:hypothetical protein